MKRLLSVLALMALAVFSGVCSAEEAAASLPLPLIRAILLG